ncbi:cupin domain-containing protein [Pararhodospirillum photometricum]|nr:cupin domain-containing protein [Pararhodospirillum photometricum]
MSETPTTDPARVRSQDAPFRWQGVDFLPYKETGEAPFKAVSRQVLFHHPALQGELRYFEVEAGGHTTLESHEHAHAVMILRGRGRVLVYPEVRAVAGHDLVFIAPHTWHQFRADAEPLGFLCLVNVERDRPRLPTEADWAFLRADPAVAAFFDDSP